MSTSKPTPLQALLESSKRNIQFRVTFIAGIVVNMKLIPLDISMLKVSKTKFPNNRACYCNSFLQIQL